MAEDKGRLSADVRGRSRRGPLGDLEANREDDPLGEVETMDIAELLNHLPLAQKHLEAVEAELEELMENRDAAIIRLAAMEARLAALVEANEQRSEGTH